MNKLLVDLFRALFLTVVVLLCAVAAGAGVWAANQSGSPALGVAAFAGGMTCVIAFAGVAALLIDNNLLLRRIADASERGAAGAVRDAAPRLPAAVPAARVEPVLRR